MEAAQRQAHGAEGGDAEDLARRLRLRARARADGIAERPGADAIERSAVEDEILALTAQRQDALADQALAEGEKLAARLRGLRPAADGASLAITGARIALRQAAGRARQELSAAVERAERTSADLDTFRRAHRRDSAAHYPDSALLAFGMLAIAVLFEAAFSASLFAQDDAHGLMGGAVTAAGLSGANVAIGFLGGFLGLRYLQHVRLTPRIVGAVCFVLALAGGLTLNGFAALWRQDTAAVATARAAVGARATIQEDYARCLGRADNRQDAQDAAAAAQRCDNTRRAGLAALSAGEGGLAQRFSPQALVLLMLGFGVWTFAALKGFSGVDDPYPDYGKLDRLAKTAREDLQDAQDSMRDDMGEALREAQGAKRRARSPPQCGGWRSAPAPCATPTTPPPLPLLDLRGDGGAGIKPLQR